MRAQRDLSDDEHRGQCDLSDDEHRGQCEAYAEQILATYRIAPVWIIALLVPRDNYPPSMREGGHIDNLMSVAFAAENLMLAARAEGLCCGFSAHTSSCSP